MHWGDSIKRNQLVHVHLVLVAQRIFLVLVLAMVAGDQRDEQHRQERER